MRMDKAGSMEGASRKEMMVARWHSIVQPDAGFSVANARRSEEGKGRIRIRIESRNGQMQEKQKKNKKSARITARRILLAPGLNLAKTRERRSSAGGPYYNS
jgi:hypothetical protein